MQIIPGIITLAIVLVILAIYRITDKTNRSMEKVRRYGDKVTEGIDKIVDEKTAVLKNIALEFEVHQKAEKQMLTRVVSIEDKLNARAGEVEALFDRVAAYDKAVTELVDMTRKVEENLQLLKAEDSFLDDLSKRIHSSNVKMDSIEKDIPRVLSDFSTKNQSQLENLLKAATKESEKLSAKLHNELDQTRYAVTEFSDYMQTLETKRDSVEEELISSAKDQLSILLESTLGEYENYSTEIKEDLNQFKQEYRDDVTEFKNETDRIKDNYRGALNKSADVLKKHLKAGDQMLSSINISVEGLKEKADYVTEIIQRVDKYDEEIHKIAKLSEDIDLNLASIKEGAIIVASSAKRLKLAENRMKEIETNLPKLEENFKQSNQENLQKISNKVKESVEQTATSFMSDFEVIKESVDEFSKRIAILNENRDRLISETENTINASVKDIIEGSTELQNKMSSSFKSDLTTFTTSLNDELQSKFSRLREEYGEMEQAITQLNQKVASDAQKALLQMEESSTSAIEGLNKESELTIENSREIFSQIKDKSEELKLDFDNKASEFIQEIESRQRDGELVITRINSVISEMNERSEQVEHLYTRLESYDQEMEKLAELNREAQAGLSRLESKNRFIQTVAGKIKRSENSLLSIENKIPKIEERFDVENERRLASAVKQSIASTEKLIYTLNSEIETASNQIDEFNIHIGVLQHRRDQLGNSMLNELKDEIKQINENAVEELTDYRKNIVNSLEEHKIELKTQISDSTNILSTNRDESQILFKAIENNLSKLDKRSTDIDTINARLSQYDEKMQTLSSMSQEAEASLSELNQKTRFVQGLSKQIAKSQSKMNIIEKRLPEIETIFATENKRQLEQVYIQVSAEGEEKLKIIEGEIQKSSNQIDTFNNELESFEQRHSILAKKSIEEAQSGIATVLIEAEAKQEDLIRTYRAEIEQLEDSFGQNSGAITENLRAFADSIEQKLKESDSEWENKLLDFKRKSGDIEAHYQENIDAVVERARDLDDEIFTSLRLEIEKRSHLMEKEMLANIDSIKNRLVDSNNELVTLFGDMRSEISIQRENAKKLIDELQLDMDKNLSAMENSVQTKITNLITTSENVYNNNDKKLNNFIENSKKIINDARAQYSSDLSIMKNEVDSAMGDISQKVEKVSGEALKDYEKIRGEINKRADILELKGAERLQQLEIKLGDFEESISYKMNNFDNIPATMDELEVSLRKYMEKETGTIRQDFIRFSEELEGQRKIEKREASSLFTEFRSSMKDIEANIEKIKSEAYQNVSEKLNLLEDGFFSDLKERSDSMNERMTTWQKGVTDSLNDISEKSRHERLRIEEQYHSDLSLKVANLQSEADKNLQSLGSKVAQFEDEISNKLTASQKEMTTLSTRYMKQLESAEKNATAIYEKKLGEHGGQLDEKLDIYQKSFENKIEGLNQLVNGGKENIDQMIEESKKDLDQWQKSAILEYRENASALKDQFSKLKADSTETISSIRDSFTTQKNQLDKQNQESLVVYKKDIAEVGAKLTQIFGQLEQKSSQLTQGISSTEAAFKISIKESRSQLIDMQENIEQRISDAIHNFDSEVLDVDKRIKSFVAQTKLFERADTLKIKLKDTIDQMKSEIAILNGQRKELKETDKNFEKIRKIESDISSKLNNMISQRRKIEEMDREFKHLLELSVNVDTRLENVAERSDQLQSIEARMRHLDELEKEVGQKYTRLDKKREILDTTTRGVDVNFQQLATLEERMKKIDSGFTDFMEHLKESNERITILSNNKPDADLAVKKLSKLDKELQDMEQRMDAMQKARKWLAETETRLKKMNDTSEEQMKILGSIMKNSGNAVKGAPTMDSKELVVRLARQGWTTAEITKSTGLSKGEVDLILEIAPRKMKS